MRGLTILFIALAGLIVQAHGDPQDLSGGALIAHYIPEVGMRYGPPAWCSSYENYGPIFACEDQTNSVQVPTYLRVTWYVVAAFEEDKEWCEVEFGLGDYNPWAYGIYYCEGCYPAGGGLEVPSPGWPGPNEGIRCVITGDPWQGNYEAVMMFTGYAYGYYGSDVVQLVPNPTTAAPFGGFRNCATPQEEFDAALGGLGINEPGTYVCWGWSNYVCCVGDECTIVGDEEECLALGGVFHPEWSDCGPPNPCVSTPVAMTSWGKIKTLYR